MPARLHLASSQPDEDGAVEAQLAVRVVLADDHAAVRQALRQLLESEPSVEVIAEAEDFAGARHEVHAQRPDVLVLDLGLPGGTAAQRLVDIREQTPDTQIVVLTTDDSATLVQRALDAGAVGYVLKELADSELAAAVHAAARGERYVSPRVSGHLDALRGALTEERITPREVEVLKLIALGHTSVEIARQLDLSPRTIETHRAHIHRKLGLATRAELVRYALGRGLLRGA
jgi:two-component system, NarL family, response regulator NreC